MSEKARCAIHTHGHAAHCSQCVHIDGVVSVLESVLNEQAEGIKALMAKHGKLRQMAKDEPWRSIKDAMEEVIKIE